MSTTPAIAIVGPTASGKTELSVRVAKSIGGEVISMDSRQVYRGMDIGTAKATREQQLEVPHHGLDLVGPDERFNAVRFARCAREAIERIGGRGHTPLLVGGTGFFLRALTDPIFREPPLDPARRAALQRYLGEQPTHVLHAWLLELDPELGRRFAEGRGGRHRIIRGIELPLPTGRSLSWWHQNPPPEAPPLRPLVFVLDPPRAQLYDRIDRRVDGMVRAGLLDEIARLLGAGYRAGHPGMNATGYAEVLPALRGEVALEDALDLVRKNTRAYARRQLTWFRHQLPEGAVWLDASLPVEELARVIAKAQTREQI